MGYTTTCSEIRIQKVIMCCEPEWTASGQTYWVVMEVTCPGFYGILICYQNTSTRMNTDSCTGRAVHSGQNAGWEIWGVGEEPPSLDWHKMQALPCCTCGFKGRKNLSSSPFCFSALQNSWTEQRLSVLIWLPARHRVLETSTHLCF